VNGIVKNEISSKRFEKVQKKFEKIEKRYDSILKKIEKLREDLRELVPVTRTVKMMEDDMNRMWKFTSELHKKIKKAKYEIKKLSERYDQVLQTFEDEVKATHERLNKLEDEMKAVGKLPKFYKDVNEKVAELEKQYNSIASDVVERIKIIEKSIRPEEMEDLGTLKDQVESIRKSMLTFNKLWADYKKEIDERLRLREVQPSFVPKEIPQNLADELISLRKIVDQLSSENEQLRKLTRDIRVAQMTSVTADMFANLSSKVSTIEKKIAELEEELSKLLKTKPIVME
jgi:predicted  nucleic acid-binding Zn-ribbon protein